MDSELTLDRLQRSFPKFKIERTKSGFSVAADHPEGIVRIDVEPDRFTVLTKNWHCHCADPHEAVWTAYYLFTGRMRTISEWRGERFAACYSQLFENEWIDAGTAAYYLAPFDREEWERWPGDKWKRKIVHRRLLGDASVFTAGTPDPIPEIGQVSIVEERLEVPHILRRNDWTLDWPKQRLGSPDEGLKWTPVPTTGSLFVQIPIGWRTLARRKPSQKFSEFAPSEGAPLLRADGFSRESQGAELSQVVDGVAYPTKTWVERPDAISNGWASVDMYCRFNHAGFETLGRLTFYWLPAKASAPDPLINRLSAAIPKARLWLGESGTDSE